MCLLKNTSILLPSFHKNMKMQYFCCILRMFLEDYSELYCYLLPGNLYCMGKNSVSWGHPVNANKMNKTLWSGNLPKKRKPITSTEAMIYIHILFWYEGHTLKFILFISSVLHRPTKGQLINSLCQLKEMLILFYCFNLWITFSTFRQCIYELLDAS